MDKKRIEPEINFKNLLKNPLRLFGWVYPAVIIVIIILGIFYVKNINDVSFNTMPVINYDSLMTVPDLAEKKGGIMPALNLELVANPTDEFIAKGKEQFNTICASCHGEKGMGDGSAAAGLNPKPRNFHQTDGWTNGRTIVDMYKTLQEGIIKNGMAAYEYLSPEERFSIIYYIRTFAEFPKVAESDISYLDGTYNLSKGIVIPNQIPIEKAMQLVEQESQIKNIKKACDFVKNNSDSPGAKLFFKVAKDRMRIFNSMLNGNLSSDQNKFINAVISDPVEIGFSSSVDRLNSEQWNLLFNFLSNSLKNINS